jgi:pimeloyl-ACP methyl ester carboxylesterase
MSDRNRMYMMKVIGADCSDNDMWTMAIREGAEALVDIPRICLYGTEDGVFPMASCQEAAQILGVEQGCCHPIEGVGHLCMLEAHDQVSDICQKFISKLV